MYETLADTPKNTLRAAVGRAEVDLATGDYEKGIARLQATKEAGKRSADWNAALADLLARVGRYEEAIERNQAALAISRKCHRARYQLGQVQETLGKTTDALATYRPFEELMTAGPLPETAEDLTCAGRGFYRFSLLSRHPDIVRRTKHVLTEVYQEAYDFVDVRYWPARLASAELLLEKHNLNDARDDFENILKQNPSVADALVGLGRIALEDWNFEEAEKRAEAALKINPRHVDARVLLAETRMIERRYVDAQQVAKEALKTNPRDIDAMSVMAAAQLRAGDRAASEKTMAEIKTINPSPAVLHFTLAKWLALGRQFTEAEADFKKAMEIAPWWSDPPTGLGQLYMDLGEEALARKTLESSFALDSFNAQTNNQLELLDSLDKFAKIETAHFILKYNEQEDGVIAPYFAETLESLYGDVCNDFDVKLDQKTLIEVFPDHMGFSVRLNGRPFIATVGACTGRVIAMTAPRGGPPFGRFNWAGVLRHEFTHTVTLAATDNRIPHWMTEGLAVHEEPVPRPWGTKIGLSQAFRSGQLFDLKSIDWGFMRPRRPTDRSMAYAQSEWMIEYITVKRGFKAVLELLAAFRKGDTQAAAFKQVLGVDEEQFTHEFKTWAACELRAWGLPTEPIGEVDALTKEVEKSPDDPERLANLAEAQLREGEIDKAEATAKKALARDEKQPKVLKVICRVLIGRMLVEKDEDDRKDFIEQAAPFIERLHQVDPESGTAILYLGYLAQSREKWPDAIDWLTKYQRKYPDDPDSYRRLAGIYLQQKRADDALRQLESLGRLADDEPAVARQIAQLRFDRGDKKDASRWYRRAIEIDPYDAATHAALGETALSLGDLSVAEREFQACCKLRPEEAGGYEGLARLFDKKGNREQAEAYRKKAEERRK